MKTHSYIERGMHSTSKTLGLTKIGPASTDAGSSVSLALNATVDTLDAIITALQARIAALETEVAAKQ
jgi:hypothetical protein